MSEHTHQNLEFSRQNSSQQDSTNKVLDREDKKKLPPPSQITKVVPFLQRKQAEGPQSYQSAVDSLHQSYGNRFVGNVVQKMGTSKSKPTIYRVDEELIAGETFGTRLARAGARVAAVYSQLKGQMGRVGLAYKAAYEQHKAVLDNENAKDKLVQDLIFGAFTAVLGGVGGALVEKLATNASKFAVEGAKGLAAYVAQQGGTAVQGLIGGGMSPASKDPLTFYISSQTRLDTELGDLQAIVAAFPNRDRQDPLAVVDRYLAGAEAEKNALAAKDDATLQFDCEKQMWQEWLQRFGWRTYTTEGYAGPYGGSGPQTHTTSVDKDIIKYLQRKFGWDEDTQRSIAGSS